MTPSIAIVVVAYNRLKSLERLLLSLQNAKYPEGHSPTLVISVDKSKSLDVGRLAQAFQWSHGEKKVIIHQENLGLREHVLSCGDLSTNFDGVIILEDDLFVSPYFYQYTLDSVRTVGGDDNVAGISLYAHSFYETSSLPFIPLFDSSDNYFMQIPSSWGQCWTRGQWARFREWYNQRVQKSTAKNEEQLPRDVKDWPETSWKKKFYEYMIEKDLYISYPYKSLSTNFGDDGTHHFGMGTLLQVPLQISEKKYQLKTFSESRFKYDSHCEIDDNFLKKSSLSLTNFDFDVDLYGSKEKLHFKKEYVLTSREVKNEDDVLLRFSRSLKPHESNIIFGLGGDEIRLTKVDNVVISDSRVPSDHKNLNYYYNCPMDFLKSSDDIRKGKDYEVSMVRDFHEYQILKKKTSFRLYLSLTKLF